ncbi:MAG: ferric iron reductase [Bacillus sp. (in: firmicutes)]|jgi:siderophore-iron reductase FhuF|nr:ferric iron reductase [Bacillus sp. (in: firmicutes)]
MISKLSEQEISILKGMRFTDRKMESDLSIELKVIYEDDKRLVKYLQNIKQEVGSPNDKVAASIFIKRYAYLAVIYLFSMTAWNKRLNISIPNITIVSARRDGLWLPCLYLKDLSFKEANRMNREDWRRESVAELFRDHFFPLINCLVKTTKISKIILWENIAIYIFWLYESVLSKNKDSMVRDQAQKDLEFILNDASGTLFGDNHQNPLTKYYSKPVLNAELNREIRLRKTCCSSYQLEVYPKMCKTCPRN